MGNYSLNPHMIAREIARLIPPITGRNNFKTNAFLEEGSKYEGVLCNLRSYKMMQTFTLMFMLVK